MGELRSGAVVSGTLRHRSRPSATGSSRTPGRASRPASSPPRSRPTGPASATTRRSDRSPPRNAGSCSLAIRWSSRCRCRSRQTFGELLEERLNRRPSPFRYRVINAGVQGYGPIEEQLFFRSIAGTVQADLVLPVVFVGNDAEEAVSSRHKLDDTRRTSAGRRRLVHDAAAAPRPAQHGAADSPPARHLRDRTAVAVAGAARAAAAELRGATGAAHRRWPGPHPRRRWKTSRGPRRPPARPRRSS